MTLCRRPLAFRSRMWRAVTKRFLKVLFDIDNQSVPYDNGFFQPSDGLLSRSKKLAFSMWLSCSWILDLIWAEYRGFPNKTVRNHFLEIQGKEKTTLKRESAIILKGPMGLQWKWLIIQRWRFFLSICQNMAANKNWLGHRVCRKLVGSRRFLVSFYLSFSEYRTLPWPLPVIS